MTATRKSAGELWLVWWFDRRTSAAERARAAKSAGSEAVVALRVGRARAHGCVVPVQETTYVAVKLGDLGPGDCFYRPMGGWCVVRAHSRKIALMLGKAFRGGASNVPG